MTEPRQTALALDAAQQQAGQASAAKSRFLVAASQDLRRPLRTLALIQCLLAKKVTGEPTLQLISRMESALGTMTGMLNALLGLNQIDVGAEKVIVLDVPVGDPGATRVRRSQSKSVV